MTRALLAALILILLAATPTTAHTVEGGWQRSDDAPEPTPTAPLPEETPAPTAAPPEPATEPEAAAGTAWGCRDTVLLAVLIVAVVAFWFVARRALAGGDDR
jgi:hypothetical protein